MARAKGRTGRPWLRAAARVKRNSNVCWICGGAIDVTLGARDPMSFTVDHVVPLALGGAERDPENLRPAHRRCNSKRGTGVVMTQQHHFLDW